MGRRPRSAAVLRVILRPRSTARLVRVLLEENARLERQLDAVIRACIVAHGRLTRALLRQHARAPR